MQRVAVRSVCTRWRLATNHLRVADIGRYKSSVNWGPLPAMLVEKSAGGDVLTLRWAGMREFRCNTHGKPQIHHTCVCLRLWVIAVEVQK
jgi:hypothetical protein